MAVGDGHVSNFGIISIVSIVQPDQFKSDCYIYPLSTVLTKCNYKVDSGYGVSSPWNRDSLESSIISSNPGFRTTKILDFIF